MWNTCCNPHPMCCCERHILQLQRRSPSCHPPGKKVLRQAQCCLNPSLVTIKAGKGELEHFQCCDVVEAAENLHVTFR